MYHLENQYKPNDDKFMISPKAGYSFMNKSAIDEDAGSEVLKILELGKTLWKISDSKDPEYKNFERERSQKGNRSFIMQHNLCCFITADHLLKITEKS